MTGTLVCTIIFMLFMFAICFWIVSKRAVSRLEYREYLFKPIKFQDINPETVEYFGRYTKEMERIGFEVLGDYVMSRIPKLHLSRFLSASNSAVFGSIDEFIDSRSCCYSSVFSDGTVMESSSMGLCNGRKMRYIATDYYRVNHMPNAATAELYAGHLEKCEHYCHESGCRMLNFQIEELHEVCDHIHRMSHWELYRRQSAPEPPPGYPAAEIEKEMFLSSREMEPTAGHC